MKNKSMTLKEKKKAAQKLIIGHLSTIEFRSSYDDYEKEIGDIEEAEKIMIEQINRINKMFGLCHYN